MMKRYFRRTCDVKTAGRSVLRCLGTFTILRLLMEDEENRSFTPRATNTASHKINSNRILTLTTTTYFPAQASVEKTIPFK